MELDARFELATSWLRIRRSTGWANPAFPQKAQLYYHKRGFSSTVFFLIRCTVETERARERTRAFSLTGICRGLHNRKYLWFMKKSYWQFRQSFQQADRSNSAKLPHFAVKSSKQKSQPVTNLLQFQVSITFRKQERGAANRKRRSNGEYKESGREFTVANQTDFY